jgi:hypothetical protein
MQIELSEQFHLLKNETYTGCLIQNKYECDGKRHTPLPKDQWIRHEGAHEAIISREQFDAVRTLLNATAEKYRKSGNSSPENPYVGKIFCSRCGRPVQRTDSKSGGSGHLNYYYTCRRCHDELKLERGIKRAPTLPLIALNKAVTNTL